MTDPNMVRFLRKMADEAKEEWQRRERAFDEYSRDSVTQVAADNPDRPSPKDVWEQALANGVHLNRQQMFDALKAAGWWAEFEIRAFKRAINTNLATGNIAQNGNGTFYLPTNEYKEVRLGEYRAKLKLVKRNQEQPKD